MHYSRHHGLEAFTGPAKNDLTNRKNTGTVNWNFSKIEKNTIIESAIITVQRRIWRNTKRSGTAAKASTIKNLACLDESRQCELSLTISNL